MVFEQAKYGHKDSYIRVIDFGFAIDENDENFQSSEEATVCMGTPYYMAPEVVEKEPVTTLSDMWSAGVVLYCMLAGYPPFSTAKNIKELYNLILSCDFDFYEQDWAHISKEAKKFIEGLIEPNLKLRMTAEEALKHPWITKFVEPPQMKPELIKLIRKAKPLSTFQYLNLLILCELLTLADADFVREAKDTFIAINKSMSGMITLEELKEALISVTDEEGPG